MRKPKPEARPIYPTSGRIHILSDISATKFAYLERNRGVVLLSIARVERGVWRRVRFPRL